MNFQLKTTLEKLSMLDLEVGTRDLQRRKILSKKQIVADKAYCAISWLDKNTRIIKEIEKFAIREINYYFPNELNNYCEK